MGLSIISQSNLKICISPLYNNHNYGDKVLSKGQKGNLPFIYLNGNLFLGLGYHNRHKSHSQRLLIHIGIFGQSWMDDHVKAYPYLSVNE